MDTGFHGEFLPHLKIRLDFDFLETVKHRDVEFTHRIVVFRRVSRGHDNPAFRHTVAAECLILQKLQHTRSQGFGNAVDFIQKENACLSAASFHLIIDAGQDFTHRVFGNTVFLSAVFLFHDIGKTECALSGVVGH